ncbi:MAG: outer membrane protein transport protein [candidate division Zixibacteria bacterium]|nr:outer membrane protein transport protein [candidate division Zixibacteria bacterium]
MRRIGIAASVLMVVLLGSSSVLASGFENTGLGTTARGMGGAFRAVADDWTASYYNPAGYAYVVDNQLGGNIGLFSNRHEITADYVEYDALGNPYGWGMVNDQSIYNFDRILNNPAAGFVVRLPIWGETVFGLSGFQRFDYSIGWRFYSPEATDFRAYNDSADAWAPSDHYRNDLDVVAFQVTASRTFMEEKMSLGLGLQLLRADLVFADMTLRDNPMDGFISARPYDRVPEFTNNQGSGYGFGLNFGMMYRLNEKLNFAITAQWPFDITLDGTTDFRYIMPSNPLQRDLVNMSQEELLYVSGELVNFQSDFETKLKLPPSMSLGLAYDVTEKLTVALDAEYTLWSRYEGFEFAYSNFVNLPTWVDTNGTRYTIAEDFLTTDLSNPTEWDNAGKIALGMRYHLNDVVTLLGGGSADQSPSRNTAQITPHFVDTGDKYSFNGGVVFHINQWDLGIVQSYISYPDRSISDFTDLNDDGVFDNFPGDYKADTYETVLSITHRF